jgi:hypothetical protein
MIQTEPTTAQGDVISVIDGLSAALGDLLPDIPAPKMRAFGQALSDVFGLFTRIGASNVLVFAAQTELNRQDIESLREHMADQRTVVGDLLQGRDETESKLDELDRRISAIEAQFTRERSA